MIIYQKLRIQLPERANSLIADVVVLCPNILHKEALASLWRFLDAWTEICDNWNSRRTCEICFKEQHLSVQWKNFKTVKTYINWYYVYPPSYAIVFMKDLGKRSLGDIEQ